MTISSSKVIPKKSPSAGPVSKEGENSSSSASCDSQQPSTSSASDESPPKSQQVPPKTKGKAPKRKRKEQNDQDEDPYMKGIRDMWHTSMEKQAERFNRSMELQQAAIQSQTE